MRLTEWTTRTRPKQSRSLQWDVSLKVILFWAVKPWCKASLAIVRLDVRTGLTICQCTLLGCKMIWTIWICCIHYIRSSHGTNSKSISHHYNCFRILKSSQVNIKIHPTATATHCSPRTSVDKYWWIPMNPVWISICPRMDLVYATRRHHDISILPQRDGTRKRRH